MKKLIISSMIMFTTLGSAQNLILDGNPIVLDQSTPMRIDSATGDIIIESQNGNLTCAEIGDPPTLSFSANPTMVESGESTTLSWVVGSNATSCTKSGAWSGVLTGSDITNGITHTEVIPNITANSSFGLRCTNNFGNSPQRTAIVTVDTGSTTCPDRPPILGGNEDRTIRLIPGAFPPNVGTPGNPASYNGLYSEIVNSGGEWPGGTGGQSFATLTSGQYASMQFTTSNSVQEGRVTMVPPGNGQGPGSGGITMSISECSGDFSMQNRCIKIGGGSPSLNWSSNPSTPATTHCKLSPNTTYYFNIVHSNSQSNNFSTTTCTNSSGYCGIIFNNQ